MKLALVRVFSCKHPLNNRASSARAELAYEKFSVLSQASDTSIGQ